MDKDTQLASVLIAVCCSKLSSGIQVLISHSDQEMYLLVR